MADKIVCKPIDKIAVSVDEAAELLSVSPRFMYDLINQYGFPSFKAKGRTLISKEGLQEWVRQQAENPGAVIDYAAR